MATILVVIATAKDGLPDLLARGMVNLLAVVMVATVPDGPVIVAQEKVLALATPAAVDILVGPVETVGLSAVAMETVVTTQV